MHQSKRSFGGSSEALILLRLNLMVPFILKVAFQDNAVPWHEDKQDSFRWQGHPEASSKSHLSHRCFNYQSIFQNHTFLIKHKCFFLFCLVFVWLWVFFCVCVYICILEAKNLRVQSQA